VYVSAQVATTKVRQLDYPLTDKDRLRIQGYIQKHPHGCWMWTGTKCAKGYGVMNLRMVQWKAHRLVCMMMGVPLPVDKVLDHICRKRSCVNPDHLRPVTLVENVMLGNSFAAVNARKKQCPKGHPYKNRGGMRTGRYCPICNKPKKTSDSDNEQGSSEQ